ncbi:hypothetical protein [Novosphingobium sp. TCA1]|jgi:hypothetical protein|uniref:hypothetical protein n=1 Tax=Novosphingobium sp. TCA1 TaxID=2682474 RepID=UPI0013065814|nr:hypothetical protein [Novosphingobium sp. TCA1]GFE72398.1 hypothetical protein NTCA1_00470 [Novosphingobium sp. TCA1]
MIESYQAASLETAACIWEHVLDVLHNGAGSKGLRGQAERIREEMGTSALRITAIGWTALADADWGLVKDDYDQPFDWAFIPAWVRANVDWSGCTPEVRSTRLIPGRDV